MGNVILLADKSVTIQKIVQLTFADDNYSIYCVADGQAAIDSIPVTRPDLVLADISLPLKTGYEVCNFIRTAPELAEFSKIPVILLAGIYETMDEERSRVVEEKVKEVQANDFLSKPFDPQVLVAKVKQYLASPGAPAAPSVFAEPLVSPDEIFTEPANLSHSEPPPDDGERTMMIPGGISFSNEMFAEPLPYDEEAPEETPQKPVDVERVKPAGEPVFDENEFERLAREAEASVEATQRVDLPEFMAGDPFTGREEQEFDMLEENGEVPLIIPEAEEPFGEAFVSAVPQPAWSEQVSEEDAPFGLPELPPVEEQVEMEPEAPTTQMEAPSVTETGPEPLEVIHGKVEEGLEPHPDFDDTWPGVPASLPEPVEELFEEPVAVSPSVSDIDEVEEIEADLPEGKIEPAVEERTAPQEPVLLAPDASSGALVISEELIERIAERVAAKLSDRVVSEIVWQVVPDLAERMIRRELEKLHAGEE